MDLEAFVAAQDAGELPPRRYGWMTEDERRLLVRAKLDERSGEPWVAREAQRLLVRRRLPSGIEG